MKRIQSALLILILLTLSACQLQMPGVQAPTAAVFVTEPPAAVPASTEMPSSTAMPAPTETALPPTAAAPEPAQPTAYPEPPTQAPEATAVPPTATQPAAAAQAEPTETEAPVESFDPYTELGDPTYENPMEFANLGEWAQAETDELPDNRNIRLRFRDGRLLVTGKRPYFSTWWFSYHTLRDAFIEMTFDTEDCSGEDAYGIIFRGPPHLAGESYGYIVSFTCDGSLSVLRLDDARPWDAESLFDEEDVSAIQTGPDESNVIGISAEGDEFVIYANGEKVAEVEDDEFEKGREGVYVRSGGYSGYTYRVTNFAYWNFDEDD